ncbi:MAG: Transposase [uncultured Rubrobacteraceae bacterium]|uniref:Mutator family transposase n=1 Tax=uncultured Rubrobacteraceae bacterium TaxID=349277 RepID=A0A6J4R914_9ACTN|nr:MAG: Transposase [uncultured Rubrobacteraceae bacterium]
MTPKYEFEHDVDLDVEARVRKGVKAVLEEVLEEEMTQHLEAGHRELTPTRRGERNGHYTRNLVTPAGKIERLEVPRDREGEFVTEVFERYKRMTGDVEEAVLEMYLSGISVRKIAGVSEALSRRVKIGKDAVSRIARRLEGEQRAWRERSLKEKGYPYLYLDATYLKVRWAAGVTSMALLACVGVDEEGFREVLAVEVAGSEKGAAYASLLRGLIDRGLSGVRLVVSDDHESIKAAVAGELPGAQWQRCVVHFERNVLAHVPASETGEVAEDLKAIFKVRREKTARTLAEGFVELYGRRFPKAVSVFEAGISDALTYLLYPGSHHARLRTTNMLERLFREVKRRTRVVGVFPNETSASTLAMEIALRSSEEWTLKRYLTMDALEAAENPNPQLSRH